MAFGLPSCLNRWDISWRLLAACAFAVWLASARRQSQSEQQLGGSVVVSVQLAPTGHPQRVVVRKTSFSLATSTPEAEQVLINEALRISQLLRFRPQIGGVDSVLFPLSFTYD